MYATAALAVLHNSLSFDTSFPENPCEYLHITLYCQKLESLSYMTAADSVGLSVFVFMQLFLKAMQKSSRSTGAKTEFNVN